MGAATRSTSSTAPIKLATTAGTSVDGHGLPYAHVFTDPPISAGNDWITRPDAIPVTPSHEALEMLADPAANQYPFNGFRLMWAREVCGAVQASTYRIVANGRRVQVSNFVLPAFVQPVGGWTV